MTVLAVLFLTLQVTFGILISSFVDPKRKLSMVEFFFMSVVLGLGLSTFLLLSILLVSGSWSVAIFLMFIILIAAGLIILWRQFRDLRFGINYEINFRYLLSPIILGFLIFLLLYLAVLFGIMVIDENGLPFAISLGWGDSAYHLNMIERLRTTDPFILEHPVISGEKLSYPFLVNLLSALYERLGFTKIIAWNLPIFSFGISSFFLIFLLGKRVFSNQKLSLALVILFFFGGGIGFLWFFQDLSVALEQGGINSFLSTLIDPPREYTHLENRNSVESATSESPLNIVWIVPAISFFSHQRSFTAGVSLALLIFLGFVTYRRDQSIWRWGLVWGMIPFWHSHSFIAVSIIIICWFFYDISNWRSWLKGGILGCIVALPQVIFLISATWNSSFFRPQLGWMMCTHNNNWYNCDQGVAGVDTNPFWFWTKNFGCVFWVWIIAVGTFLFMKGKNKDEFRSKITPFIVPSLVLFIITNVFLFQPWEFDNNKIIFYWWIFASISSIAFFQHFYKRFRILPFVFILFIFLSSFSGIIDVLARISHYKGRYYGYYGLEETEIAKWIRESTSPNARFLTSNNPDQFIPMLTGRSIYVGYPGWLWSQGKASLMYQRQDIARKFLATGDSSLVCNDGIKYVLWDKRLLETYPGARREKVLIEGKIVFSQENGELKREIFEIQCP